MTNSKTAHYMWIIIFLLLFVQCTGNKEKRLHNELVKRATELNSSTPVALDEHTRFDSVRVSTNNEFKYYYTIIRIDNPTLLIAQHKEEMIETMDRMYATDKSLQFFATNHVTMKYIYNDLEGNIIDVITIEAGNYAMDKNQP